MYLNNRKNLAMHMTAGVQFPMVRGAKQGSDRTLLSEEDLVKFRKQGETAIGDGGRSLMTSAPGLGNVTVTPAKSMPFIRRLMERENLEKVAVKRGNVDAVREVAKQFGKTIDCFKERDATSAGHDPAIPFSPGSREAGQVGRSQEEKGIIGGATPDGRTESS